MVIVLDEPSAETREKRSDEVVAWISGLAKKIFGADKVSEPCCLGTLYVYSGTENRPSADIHCPIGVINVYREEAYRPCLKLARRCEWHFWRDFLLVKKY